MDRHLRLLTAGGACIYNARHHQARRGRRRRAALPAAGEHAGRHHPQQGGAEYARPGRVPQHDGRGLSVAGERAGMRSSAAKAKPSSRRTSTSRAPDTTTPPPTSSPSTRPLPMTENRYAVLSGNAGHGHGRSRCRRQVLLRLSHEPLHRRAALDGVARAQGRHPGAPGRGRDWRHQYGDRRGPRRRALHVRDLRRRLCADDRGPRPLGDGGDSRRRDQLHARRPVHRRAHQDRAGRPVAGAGRGLWRLSPRHRGAAGHRRLLHPDAGDLQHHGQVPVSRHRALRPAALRGPAERRARAAQLQPAHRSRRAHHLQRRGP